MFEDSLFSSANHDRPKRWTALLSFTIQTVLVASLMVLPMLFTASLPFHPLRAMVQLRSLPPAGPVAGRIRARVQQDSAPDVLRVPRSIPLTIGRPVDPPNASATNLGPPDLSGNTNGGSSSMSSLLGPARTVTPVIQRTPHKSVRVSSGVEQGLLILKVNPIYPALARSARVQGEVILQAVIGKDGRIENLHAVSGPPMLVKAALDAVQQWRYRPYMLNGEAVGVETQITVRFTTS